ncbi:hypothetical protein R3W88_004879 [Solanum pinnatisectum]|uniref:Uncharacterized protein n=1 Tax=Solanum pinnatisectum TaxID=50273 RepID=A0AAV9KAI4_9SOLN|nr:hypothetical protein R3W88_004879 [Solanum pinnatisectum]
MTSDGNFDCAVESGISNLSKLSDPKVHLVWFFARNASVWLDFIFKASLEVKICVLTAVSAIFGLSFWAVLEADFSLVLGSILVILEAILSGFSRRMLSVSAFRGCSKGKNSGEVTIGVRVIGVQVRAPVASVDPAWSSLIRRRG